MGDEVSEGEFSFTVDDDVGAGGEVFGGVVDWFGATEDDGGINFLADFDLAEDVKFGHHVDVEANDGGAVLLEVGGELVEVAKGGIVEIDIETGVFEVGGDVEEAEGGIWFHDLLFMFIFGDEVAVAEKDIHHCSPWGEGWAASLRVIGGGRLMLLLVCLASWLSL